MGGFARQVLATQAERPSQPIYAELNRTPIRWPDRHATWQSRFRFSGLIHSAKWSGTAAGPLGPSISRQAPVSDMLRMRHTIAGAVPNRIEPPLKVRIRCDRRGSGIYGRTVHVSPTWKHCYPEKASSLVKGRPHCGNLAAGGRTPDHRKRLGLLFSSEPGRDLLFTATSQGHRTRSPVGFLPVRSLTQQPKTEWTVAQSERRY
jgi:hypothetical protein